MIDFLPGILRLRVTCLLTFWITLAFSTAQAASQSDAWPRYAHDAALTARSPLHGNITQPYTRWSYSTAGRELLIEIVPASGEHKTSFTDQTLLPQQEPRLPAPRPVDLDIDGSGTLRPAPETFHERWAKVLRDLKGLQRVAWTHTWTDQKVCRLQLFAYDAGFDKPRLVWQTDPPEDTIFQPLDIIADLDGDGVPEICVAAHYRVMIFDGITGRKKTELRYHHSRPYGWFGLADVDGDGQQELITIGDFQSHIDVLNYDPMKPEAERLSVRWRRDLEQNIDERKKWPQVGPHPVVDVAGDSRPELLLNLFNDTGDGQWHTVVLNAATGEQLFDLPRQFLQGTADLQGDGKSELFVIGTDGVFVPSFGTIQLIDLHGPSVSVRWSQKNSAWACADLPAMGSSWSTSASQGMRHVLLGGPPEHPAFLVAQRKSSDEAPFLSTLTAMRSRKNGQLEKVWQVSGLPGELQFVALGLLAGSNARTDQDLGATIRLQIPQGLEFSLIGRGAEPRVIQSQPLGVTVSTPIAAPLRSNGPVTVIVEGAAQHIFALQPSGGTNAPRLLWRRAGRGMSDGSRSLGPVAADLLGDGANEVIVAGQDSSGRALLLAYRENGKLLWQTLFDQTLGAVPIWNVAALTFWWPGSFRASGKTDLFVNTRRGLMHSDVGHLLDGRTGAIIWRQDKAIFPGQFNWGYAGIPIAVADLDGDGLDDLISLNPVCFWAADGRTGALTRGVELASRTKLPAWAAYGEPILYRFAGDAAPKVILDSPYILALLETNGTPIWNGLGRADYPTSTNEGNVGQTTSIKHALIDLAGDRRLEIASAGYADGVRAIDAQDGKVLWSLQAPTPTCHRVVAVDIDGRKGEELLYTSGSKLIAITGNRSSGRILWEWQGPASLSMPAIADVDGKGLAEIIVQAADGSVHCIGSPP